MTSLAAQAAGFILLLSAYDVCGEQCDTDRGFIQQGSNCFNFVQLEMSWHDANDYCLKNFDSYLTSIISSTEQAYVAGLSDLDLWIGLSDTVTPGSFSWVNGHDTLELYENWVGGQRPSITNRGSTCVKTNSTLNDQWNAARCSEEKMFVCKKGLSETCPDGWNYFNGKCYNFYLNDNYFTTWSRARDFCQEQNSDLLKIESADEQQYIASYFSQWREDGILQVWLGISDLQVDDYFRWSDGSIISYTQWDTDPSEIRHPGVDDCGWLYTGKEKNNWELGDCFSLQAFICQIREGISLSPIPKPVLQYKCENGWRLFKDHCYLFDGTKRNFDEAEAFCTSPDNKFGHLASVLDEDENSFFAGNLKGQSWIGMTDRVTEGTFIWIDGSPADYYNWKLKQPNSDGDCVRMIGIDDDNAWGQFNDQPCTNTDYTICKIPAEPTSPYTPTVDTDPNEGLCGTGYYHNSGTHKCYKIVSDYERSWADARLHCQQDGGDLVSINSPEEQSFLEFHLSYLSVGSVWIGGIDQYNGPDGLPDVVQNSFDGGWQWSDDSPFNFVNWNAGEPNTQGDEDCVEMYTGTGLWNDITCTNPYGYVCEKEDPEHVESPADCTSADCCFRHVGFEKGGSMDDSQLSASSQLDQYSGAERGRLNTLDQYVPLLDVGPGRGAWVAADTDSKPWLKVDLLAWYEIRGIVSQGRNGLSQPNNQNDWVKQYSVQYMINPVTSEFEDYTDVDGSVLIFDGNYDQDDQVTNIFPRPVVTTAIKIFPTSCRKKCAMRVELVGCPPSCLNSLGVSTNSIDLASEFPVLGNEMFSASSQQAGFEAFNARLDYSEGNAAAIQNYLLDDATMTYDTARAHCISNGADLCLKSEICVNGEPTLIGIQTGDQWAPIRDGYNDWVELGNDNDDDGRGRVCYRHNEYYAPPSWGTTTGSCPPWNTQKTCDLKGNVFCCPVNTKSWKPTSSSRNEWIQVDLGAIRKISGVAVQGDPSSEDRLTGYHILFSDEGQDFETYRSPDGQEQIFPGSANRNTPVEGYLREPISSRYIRIKPQSWNNNIALRMDILGCNVQDRADCTDKALDYTDSSFIIDCPGGCDKVADKLWGTGVYTDDSYICAAAIHDGRYVASHGGTVTVKKVAGQSSYTGSKQHGITSMDYASWPSSITFQGDHLGCPTGWTGWQDWCYYVTRRTSMVDYSTARDICQSYGGDLASIHSQAEQDFVVSHNIYGLMIPDDLWIGMTDFERTNYFKWEDGTDVTYTMWNFNEPNGGDREHCVQMYSISGFWNDKSCDAEMNFMCKMDKIPVNQQQSAVDGCPNGWVAYEASCYLFDISASVWTNAEDFCSDQGGHLAAITSYHEQMFVASQAAQTSHPDIDQNFYIGLGAFVEPSGSLVFRWSSGELVTFTAWDRDQPYILHKCVFPFLYEGVEYYTCISKGKPYELLGGPWCSADAVYTNHPVPCEGLESGQVGCIVLNKDNGLWSQADPVGCGSPEYRVCENSREGYTTPQGPTTPSPNGNCPVGWYGYNNGTFCYQINELIDVADQLSWEQAKLHCESQGSVLASIHSPQEEAIIASAIQGLNGNYAVWIGLKREMDGTYGWSDKTPLAYTNWGDDEPNNHNGREDCVEATFYPGNIYWNDLNCDSVRNWVCKVERGKDLVTPATFPAGTLSPQICGSDVDWVAYTNPSGQQKCYYFGNSPVQSWHQSNTYCQSLGGSLVSITSLDEQQFITGRASKTGVTNLWIGLVQDTMNGPFLWVDGSPVVFENWQAGGQPNDNFGQELCVEAAASNGLWSDSNCGLTFGFICQKLVGAQPMTPDPTPVLPGGCPYNWLPYGSKCFLEVGFTDQSLRSNWEDSEAYCESNNGFLASITNEYYSAFLTSQLFACPSNIWIGLNSRGSDLQFKWSDNSDVQYTNWAPGEPNNSEGGEECAELRWEAKDAGQWNDYRCKETLPFFCSRDKSTDFSPEYQGDNSKCPSGHDFVQWDTGCYKVYSASIDQMSWKDARDKCRAEGQVSGFTMDLASVWNVYENNFLQTFFWPQTDAAFQYIYLGMYYELNTTTGENSFKWSDQSPTFYTRWGTNEPQIPASTTGCVVMDTHGTWMMMSESECQSMRFPFICKHETLTIPVQDPGAGTCEEHWAALGDYCYLVTPGHNSIDLRSWGDADKECQNRMGYLASIHSDIENKAFVSWTDQKNVWIGLQRNGWGGWDWVDKTPLDFTKWAEGEPSDSGETGEACVELYTNGGWNDAFCSTTRGFICKKHKTYSTCAYPIDQRDDCGYDGISEYECISRGCCWDEAGSGPHPCFYSKADSACIEKGGTCKDYRYVSCELGYETNLCSGGAENQCCFSCASDDDVCNDQVTEWETGDEQCEASSYGTCQYDSNYCASGSYESGKCGGPTDRKCCVVNPPTLPPDFPTTTTVKPGTTTTSGHGETTTTRPVVVTTTTNGPTIINQPGGGGGGLDGGAIAGIVIAVLFIVVGGGVAFYFYRRGDMKVPDIKVPFSSGSSRQATGGFTNPIIYSQDSVTMGNDDNEFDA